MNNISPEILQKSRVYGPVGMAVIEAAQKKLDVVFPAEYIQFLSKYGSIYIDGYAIYGLPVDNPDGIWGDVIFETESIRKAYRRTQEDVHHLLLISDDGMGTNIFLDTRYSPETRICAYGPGVDIDPFYESFDDFIAWLDSGDIVF